MAETVLKANNISIVFGGLRAVDNFSIDISLRFPPRVLIR